MTGPDTDWCDSARAHYRYVLAHSTERELQGLRRIRRKRLRMLREQALMADAQDPRPINDRLEPATTADAERDAEAYRRQPDEATLHAYHDAQRRAVERLTASDPLVLAARNEPDFLDAA